MSAAPPQVDPNKVSSGRAAGVTTVVGVFLSNILRLNKILPFPYEYMVAYGVAFLIGYWIPPKPTYSFRQFGFRTLGLITGFHAGLWAIPKMLDGVLWRPAAYALPLFFVILAGYWTKPLYPTNHKKSKFWIWLIFAATFAIAYGWSMVNE